MNKETYFSKYIVWQSKHEWFTWLKMHTDVKESVFNTEMSEVILNTEKLQSWSAMKSSL